MEAAVIDARRDPDGTLVIRLAGDWSLRAGLPSTSPIEDVLAREPKPPAVAFDAKDLLTWDSAVVTVVERIGQLCARSGVRVRRDELPDGLKRILALRRRSAGERGRTCRAGGAVVARSPRDVGIGGSGGHSRHGRLRG